MSMKTCPLCGEEKIQWRYQICRFCYKFYRFYITEPWFIELVRMQAKQDAIDIAEAYCIPYITPTDIYGAQQLETSVYRTGSSVEKPRTLVQRVLDLYDESLQREKNGLGKRLALRKISKLLDNKVSYCTVRNILIKKRSDSFKRKPKTRKQNV